LELPDGQTRSFDSVSQFRGPRPDRGQLPSWIHQAWSLTLCREPTPQEMTVALEFAVAQLRTLEDQPAGIPEGSSAVRQVLVNLCQMLLNSNEFLYVD
jgi:hypothetical protein